ncbi:MAG: hypothetical protein ACAH59_09920 [Pseudobdellovibrionaceae bacterium]
MKKPLLLLSLIGLISCHRPQDEGSSVSIRIPSVKEFKASRYQNTTASTVDYSRLCFAVNVKGPGISGQLGSTCNIDRGLFEGTTVPPGQNLKLDVPAGSDRVFEVYGFLRDSTSESCPIVSSSSWNFPLYKIYYLGEKSGVTVAPPETQVEIKITLPSTSQPLAVQRGWPLSCNGTIPAVANGLRGNVVVGAKELASASYKLRAHVSEKNLDFKLTGPNGTQFKGGVR